MLAVGAERHRLLAAQPSREVLVGPDQAIRLHREQNGPEGINDLVGEAGLVGNFGIKPDEGQPQPRFHHHIAGLPGNVIGRNVFPSGCTQVPAERCAPAGRVFQL